MVCTLCQTAGKRQKEYKNMPSIFLTLGAEGIFIIGAFLLLCLTVHPWRTLPILATETASLSAKREKKKMVQAPVGTNWG